MTSSQSPDIVQIPWFPKTEPPLGGGAKAGEWQLRRQQDLATIAKSLVYEVSATRVNSLPSPWSRALQFEQAILNSKYPTRSALLEEWFGGMPRFMGYVWSANGESTGCSSRSCRP